MNDEFFEFFEESIIHILLVLGADLTTLCCEPFVFICHHFVDVVAFKDGAHDALGDERIDVAAYIWMLQMGVGNIFDYIFKDHKVVVWAEQEMLLHVGIDRVVIDYHKVFLEDVGFLALGEARLAERAQDARVDFGDGLFITPTHHVDTVIASEDRPLKLYIVRLFDPLNFTICPHTLARGVYKKIDISIKVRLEFFNKLDEAASDQVAFARKSFRHYLVIRLQFDAILLIVLFKRVTIRLIIDTSRDRSVPVEDHNVWKGVSAHIYLYKQKEKICTYVPLLHRFAPAYEPHISLPEP